MFLNFQVINMRKKNAIAALLIIIFFIVIIFSQKRSLTYQKMQGWSTVDARFSKAQRNNTSYVLFGNFKYQNRKVKLPYSVYTFKEDLPQSLNRQLKEYGRWKFISRKPDSILIEDPKVFFSGRYGVEFGIARGYREDTLWVALSNDSTHIVLNKLSSSVPYDIQQKWLE